MAKKRVPRQQNPTATSDPDLWECILEELRSPDEDVRARAVRRVCPCRAGFDLPYEQVAFLVQNDPSATVRDAAAHVLTESCELTEREVRAERVGERQEEAARGFDRSGDVGRRPRARGWRRAQLPLRIRGVAKRDA
jgi:hypothetical protein